MVVTGEASRLPSNAMRRVLQELNLPAELGLHVYHALRGFHEDPSHPERLDLELENDEAHVDNVFHDFLRKNGTALFSALKGRGANRNPGPPAYRDDMNASDLNNLFFPVRNALLILSQEWRKEHQHSDSQNADSSMIAPSQVQSSGLAIPVAEPKSDNPDTLLASVIPSSSGYPSWASGKCTHHREARGILNNPSITYPHGEGCTNCRKRSHVCTFSLSRSTCASCTARGLNSSLCHFEESAPSNHTVQNKTTSLLPLSENGDSKLMDEATSRLSLLPPRHQASEDPRTTTSNRAKRAISILTEDENDHLQPVAKRTTRKTSPPPQGSATQSHASDPHTTSPTTKPFLPPKRVYVKLCILNTLSQWTEWRYGRLSQHDTSTLFDAIARSYNIQNNHNLVAVEFRLVDAVKPEAVLLLRRAGDLQQTMGEIRERIMAQSYRGDFRVCVLPVVVAADKEEEWFAIEM